MVGSYDIEVRQRRLVYKLSIKRNMTIILGHSASGKTKLIELIRSYNLLGNESGVMINCDRPCIVLAGKIADISAAVHGNAGSIFFMDEDQYEKDEKSIASRHASGRVVLAANILKGERS